jgi:MFS transporter, OFA family, oxalate/formate antiporter
MPPSLALLRPLRVPAAPNGGEGWVVVAAAFSIYFVTVSLQYTQGVLYRGWLTDPAFVGASPSLLAWGTSIETMGFLIGSLGVGLLIPRIQARGTVLVGALLILAGSMGAAEASTASSISLSPRLAVLFSCYGLAVGSGCALAHIASIAAVQSFFTTRRGLATGITVAGSGVGAFAVGPMLEYFCSGAGVVSAGPGRAGWEGALRAWGGLASAVCVLGAVLLRPIEIVAAPPMVSAAAAAAAAAAVGQSLASEERTEKEGALSPPPTLATEKTPLHPPIPSYPALFRTPFFKSYALFVAAIGFCWFSVPVFLPVYIRGDLGGSSQDVAAVLAVQGVANTVGRVLIGHAADVWPAKKRIILTVCVAGVAAATAVLAVARSLPYTFVFVCLYGGLGGSVISLQPALVIDALGVPFVPLAQGAFNAIQAPFALAGPPIGGAVREATGAHPAVFGYLAGTFALACALSLNIEGGGGGGGKAAAGICCRRRGEGRTGGLSRGEPEAVV